MNNDVKIDALRCINVMIRNKINAFNDQIKKNLEEIARLSESNVYEITTTSDGVKMIDYVIADNSDEALDNYYDSEYNKIVDYGEMQDSKEIEEIYHGI